MDKIFAVLSATRQTRSGLCGVFVVRTDRVFASPRHPSNMRAVAGTTEQPFNKIVEVSLHYPSEIERKHRVHGRDPHRSIVFTVEIRIMDEASLAERMTEMREWLDHQRFEPARFRLTYSPGIVLQVDFTIEAEASAFAQKFGGHVAA